MTVDTRHFKLTNGDELVCEVLEWDSDESSAIVIRKALKLITVDDIENKIKYFSFRPWMMMQEDIQTISILNGDHIVGQTNPTQGIMDQYNFVISKMIELTGEAVEVQFDSIEDEMFESMDMDFDTFDSDVSPQTFH